MCRFTPSPPFRAVLTKTSLFQSRTWKKQQKHQFRTFDFRLSWKTSHCRKSPNVRAHARRRGTAQNLKVFQIPLQHMDIFFEKEKRRRNTLSNPRNNFPFSSTFSVFWNIKIGAGIFSCSIVSFVREKKKQYLHLLFSRKKSEISLRYQNKWE